MADLLSHYSLTEILIILAGVAVAIKSAISFMDWAWGRLKSHFDIQDSKEKTITDFKEVQERHEEELKAIREQQNEIKACLDRLVQSDKDQLKTDITKQYHYFSQLGKIDDFSLDCLEHEFDHYLTFGGNSFIESLMEQIRSLPKTTAKDCGPTV